MPVRTAVVFFLILLFAPRQSSSQTAPTWPAAQWPRSEPEAQGMSSAELANMLEQIDSDNPGIRSVTIVRHGTVVLDVRIAPFPRGDRHDIHSCTKSVVSALVGIAMHKGELPGPDTPVLSFFPNDESTNSDADKRAITLRHLLTMSAGLKTEDSYLYDWVGLGKMRASPDWAQHVLDLPMQTEPGTQFEYSNGVSQLLTIILQNATGRSAESYAREHLFGPIGIADFEWDDSGPDYSWGYSGLHMHPLDMARLGYLYLRKGVWDGVQVVPADWVRDSTSPQIDAGTMAKSYGYQWWVSDDVFMMQGYGGQIVYVVPARDLVVVFTGALEQRRYFVPRTLLSSHIETAVIADNAVPSNPTASARLDSLVQVLGSGIAETPQPLPELAQTISGKTFEFAPNKMGLSRLILRFTPGAAEAGLEFRIGTATANVAIGLDGVFRIGELFGQRWAWRGNWVDEKTFALEQEALGNVIRRRVTMIFEGDALRFVAHDWVNDSVDIYSATLATAPPVGH